MIDKGRLQFEYPVYPDLKLLPNNNRAYACWYYYTLAQKVYEKIGDSIDDQFGILENEMWLSPHYEQIARSVALMYGFNDPSHFMEKRFWEVVERQAAALGLPKPADRIKFPLRLVLPT